MQLALKLALLFKAITALFSSRDGLLMIDFSTAKGFSSPYVSLILASLLHSFCGNFMLYVFSLRRRVFDLGMFSSMTLMSSVNKFFYRLPSRNLDITLCFGGGTTMFLTLIMGCFSAVLVEELCLRDVRSEKLLTGL